MNIEQIDEAVEYFINYSSRYWMNKDNEDVFSHMLDGMSKEQMLEVLFQIGVNVPIVELEKYVN